VTAHFEPLESRIALASQPVLPEWLVAVGGTEAALDLFGSSAIHPSGDVYVTARFSNTVDFDPGPGKAELTSAGDIDIAVARYTQAGDLVWARRVGGGSGVDIDVSITIDRGGNAYVTGEFDGAVDIGGTPYTALNGYYDGFLVKLDDSGNIAWTKQFALDGAGVGGMRPLSGVAVDDRDANASNWSVFVTGFFWGTGQFGSQTLTANARDAFVSKLNANSGNFEWTKTIGGSNNQTSVGLALASDGDPALYATGQSETVTKDKGVTQTTVTNYLNKYNPATGDLLWTRVVAPTGAPASPRTVAADGSNVYVAGSFNGTLDFDPGPGAFNLTSAGDKDGAVLKLDSAGNFVWARRFGGAALDAAHGLALSPAGNVYVAGSIGATADFGADSLTPARNIGAYVTQLDGAGVFVDAQGFPDNGIDIAVDVAENVYVSGAFFANSTSPMPFFPTGDRVALSQGTDAALLKFSTNAPAINPTPTIDSFTASPDSVPSTGEILLRVGRVHDPDVRFQTVNFYRDNGDGVFNAADEVLIGTDANSAGGWTVSVSVNGLATGDYKYFAEGADSAGVALDVAAASVHVTEVEVLNYASAAVPRPIRDLTTVTSTINVPESFTVLDIDVTLSIAHSFDADLDVFLIGPDGTRVQLFADIGGSNDNFTGTILDDEAATAITSGAAPFTGRFKPQASLTTFNGKNAAGVWTLEITDDQRRDTGTLNAWSIQLSRAVAPAPAPPLALQSSSPIDATDDISTWRLDTATVDQLLSERESTWFRKSLRLRFV
jgi:subtilisin-like proprotein convertase family protein